MIQSLHFKNHFTFDEACVKFKNGLVVFSGPSGAGKSLFFGALLSVLGHSQSDANLIEATVLSPLDLEKYGIEQDDFTVFKSMKQKSQRYFINSQTVPQKVAKELSQSFVSYLSVRDSEDFENTALMSLLDDFLIKEDEKHSKNLSEFRDLYKHYISTKKTLENILHEEKKVDELKEFAVFEINKIEKVSPKIGEDDELMNFKKRLSKKEKIQSALLLANEIFTHERAVNSALELLGESSVIFDESMNNLREKFENEQEKLNELEETNIEEILNRIEQISSLKNRFGSIEEILKYKTEKKEELARYENITFEKKELEKEYQALIEKLSNICAQISSKRADGVKKLEHEINIYLEKLYLEPCSLVLSSCELYALGQDEIVVLLKNINVKKISSGEFNRLRVAFIAVKNKLKAQNGRVLILDEVDSNLSGKESMSVANVLKELSLTYQIFAISHHPQLSSQATQHFYVYKENEKSFIKELKEEEITEELARMISGENITDEARDFAKELIKK